MLLGFSQWESELRRLSYIALKHLQTGGWTWRFILKPYIVRLIFNMECLDRSRVLEYVCHALTSNVDLVRTVLVIHYINWNGNSHCYERYCRNQEFLESDYLPL